MHTLIDTAALAGNFTTLIVMRQAGSLIDTRRTSGPHTLFAPPPFGAVTWRSGIDLAPETLYLRIRESGVSTLAATSRKVA